jgi:uncharacterized protein (TIGR02594 family)
MNQYLADVQASLGIEADGIPGPITDEALRAAAMVGRVTIKPMPQVSASERRLPWISALQTVFGLHEKRDKAKLAAWLKSDGSTLGDPTALPWCGDAVETAIKLALPGEPFPGPVGENPYFARNWVHFGRKVDPAYGAVAVFERGPSSGHVGFMIGQDASNFFVFGGNQGDSVSIVSIAKSRLLAARWPSTTQIEPGPLPMMDGAKIPKSVNEF